MMRVSVLALSVALSLVSVSASAFAGGNGRPTYQARCDLPRAGWNEEILRVRERASAECKANLVLRASDRSAPISTEAQDQFWTLKSEHDALVRSAK